MWHLTLPGMVGGNSFWADAQRDKSFCDVKIKILEHHQTDNRFTSDFNLEMHSFCTLSLENLPFVLLTLLSWVLFYAPFKGIDTIIKLKKKTLTNILFFTSMWMVQTFLEVEKCVRSSVHWSMNLR